MDLKEIINAEKSIAKMIDDLKEKITTEIEATPFLKNVKPIAQNIVIVKLSYLQNSVWTPEYYIPAVQANYVRKSLDGVSTAHSFVKKMKEMIERRGTTINGQFYRFNDTTVSILKRYYSSTQQEEASND